MVSMKKEFIEEHSINNGLLRFYEDGVYTSDE